MISTAFSDLANELALLKSDDNQHPGYEAPWWPPLPSEAVRLLDLLRPGGPWQLSAFLPEEGQGQGVLAQSAADVDRFIAIHNGTRNIYYSINPVRDGFCGVKAAKRDIAAIEFAHADLDPRDDETPEQAKARYLAAIEHDGKQPVAIVDSGNGLQALYRLARIDLPNHDEKTIEDVETRIKALLLSLGGTSGTQNVDRILRLPGTINLPTVKKRNTGRSECRAHLIAIDEDAPVYALDAFPRAWTSAGREEHDTGGLAPDIQGRTRMNGNAFTELADDTKVKGHSKRSGAAYRFCCDKIRIGHDYDAVLAMMLEDEHEVGDWAREKQREKKTRELKRTYDNAATRVLEDASTPKQDISGKIVRFDPWEEYNAPPFPADVLPPDMAEYVSAVAEGFGCGNAAIGMGVLLAVSTALDLRTRLAIQKSGDFRAHGRLWVLYYGASSSMKTPIIKEIMAYIVSRERENDQRYRQQKAFWDKQSAEFKKDHDAPNQPTRYIVKGVTIEKLGELAALNPHGLTLVRDELAGLIADLNRYGNDGARTDMLQFFDCDYYRMERKSHKDAEHIDMWGGNILGGMQPARLAELVIKQGLTSDGLLQRFLPILMPDMVYSDGVTVNRTKYEAVLRRIMHGNRMLDRVVTLKPEAQELMNGLQRRLFDIAKASDGIVSGFFSEFVQKLRGLAGSLTLILHVAHHPGEQLLSIDKDIVEKVDRLISEFLLPHAMLFYQQLGGTGLVNDTTRKLASWIITSKRDAFTSSDLMANVSGFRGQSLFVINRLTAPLVASDWIKPTTIGPDNHKWTVSDWVFAEFAERAAEEERRKTELAKLMHSPRRSAE